jgi:ribA/ribD-fused uncharacterized protein
VNEPITDFRGRYRFLSNFAPSRVLMRGAWYPTVENAYQAAKVLDAAARTPFLSCSARDAKRMGRRVVLRADWESIKMEVMLALLRAKFTYSPLRQQLLATGAAHLEEGNTWGDRFWGVCGGEGENHLGRLLMQVRAEILRGER